MNKNILLAGAALSVVPSLVAAKAPQKRVQPKQPNIIFILCDDMGYGDLACYGQPYISTPNIDRMAEEGMRFTQAYAGSPVSAPSRASIMTGQHSGHGHVRGNREYWSNDRTVMYGNNVDFAVVGQEPYDPQHKILPEMLKDHGYTTGVFGKWAGGYEGSPSTPDSYIQKDDVVEKHPTIDYQTGSIRDDFDFGQLVLIRASLLHEYAAKQQLTDYKWAGFYDLRLYISRKAQIFHLNEYLYTQVETDSRKSGERQFDYVNPRNREVQIEMEQTATKHLDKIGAMVDTSKYTKPDYSEQDFTFEASVIIPVFNRAKTIADAVSSALAQKTTFKYNVIVVDNHSTDGTSAILEAAAAEDKRLIHIVPERTDLGIGGCWNVAIDDARCGRFAVQLDSDDLYSSPQTLQRIVDEFHKQGAAMIVGSYRMCNFQLETLPPGLIVQSHLHQHDYRQGCNDNVGQTFCEI
jgi:hypothetical protein